MSLKLAAFSSDPSSPFFKSQDGRRLTRLPSRLKFYGVTLVFANSPESKGKIERRHQIWQEV